MHSKKIAIVAIAKNEEPFIKEWVAYHYSIGVDHFFLYDNGNTPSLEVILKDFADIVTITSIKKELLEKVSVQARAYRDAQLHAAKGYQWLAFIDIDEFIVLNTHSDIQELLTAYNQYDQILLHWKVFGHNGQYENSLKLVTETHKYREAEPTGIVKSIVKQNPEFYSPAKIHFSELWNGAITVDAAGQIHTPTQNIPWNPTKTYDAHINHYQCRSYKNFMARRKRGEASVRCINHYNTSKRMPWQRTKEAMLQKFVTYFSFTCHRELDKSLDVHVQNIHDVIRKREFHGVITKPPYQKNIITLNRNQNFTIFEGQRVYLQPKTCLPMLQINNELIAMQQLSMNEQVNNNLKEYREFFTSFITSHFHSKNVKKCLVLCTPRSGSNLLTITLGKHPQIINYGETLSDHSVLAPPADFDTARLWRYLKNLSELSKVPHAIHKIFPHHLEDRGTNFEELLQAEANANVIVLYRRDLLAQYASLQIAEVTGIWVQNSHKEQQKPLDTTITIDTKKLLAYINHTKKTYAKLRDLVRSREKCLILSYEELTDQSADMYQDTILPFLQTEDVSLTSLTKKQQHKDLSEVITNYDEVVATIETKRYLTLFDQPDPNIVQSTIDTKIALPMYKLNNEITKIQNIYILNCKNASEFKTVRSTAHQYLFNNHPKHSAAHSFVICSERSGSNMLTNCLDNHKDIAYSGEVLSPGLAMSLPLSAKKSAVFEYIKCIESLTKTSHLISKIHLQHLHERNITIQDFLEHFNESKIIVLYRKDLLAQYSSRETAKRTNNWVSWQQLNNQAENQLENLEIDIEELSHYAQYMHDCYSTLKNNLHLASHHIITSYEEVAENPNSYVSNNLLPFLDLAKQSVETRTEKQQKRPLSEYISNYQEVINKIPEKNRTLSIFD